MNDDTPVAATKVGAVWIGWLYGGFTDFPIAKLVLWATLFYTLVQTYKLLRDIWRDHKAKKAESAAFAAAITKPESDK